MNSALGNLKNDYICIEDNSRYSVALHADVFLCVVVIVMEHMFLNIGSTFQYRTIHCT